MMRTASSTVSASGPAALVSGASRSGCEDGKIVGHATLMVVLERGGGGDGDMSFMFRTWRKMVRFILSCGLFRSDSSNRRLKPNGRSIGLRSDLTIRTISKKP